MSQPRNTAQPLKTAESARVPETAQQDGITVLTGLHRRAIAAGQIKPEDLPRPECLDCRGGNVIVNQNGTGKVATGCWPCFKLRGVATLLSTFRTLRDVPVGEVPCLCQGRLIRSKTGDPHPGNGLVTPVKQRPRSEDQIQQDAARAQAAIR